MTLNIPNSKVAEVVMIDDSDYKLIKRYAWKIVRQKRDGYVRKYVAYQYYPTNDWTSPKTVYMHRMIMQPEKGMIVEHINGNGLDNRRSNLRIVTKSENNRRNRPN